MAELSMTGRQRVMALMRGQRTDAIPLMPITMSLAADQLARPYREYATDWRTLVEGQTATAERFGFDHVSAISDPCVESSDLGSKVVWFDDRPPANDEENPLLADKSRFGGLELPVPGSRPRAANRLAAVEGLKARCGGDLIVEGWVEGPCAEAADLRGLQRLMLDFYDDPAFVNEVMDFVTAMEIDFALAQIRAGADIVGIGDAASSLVGPEIYAEFSAPRTARYIDAIHAAGGLVRLHICGDTNAILGALGGLAWDILDLDSMVDLAEARRILGPSRVLLGNADPVAVIARGDPAGVRDALARCHAAAAPAWIVGAGCELPRESPPGNVEAMAAFAREG
ncbi:MAG: uroporphyrinogen decarboxylase family protein [Treponema sp.]|nr:uroporphyrinogen decarboxylase family protein [Treponema sp.]